jgi:VIT1/CCC1 family predicted Fe2+/Mn2+ transporter
MIITGVVLACVINGDTMSGVLRQATWLVLAITVLIVVQAVALNLPRRPVKPAAAPDING